MPLLEREVTGNGLHQVLAVVEDALDRDVHDGRVVDAEHLGLLERRHPSGRREHEHPDALQPPHRVLRGRPGVAAGGAKDGQLAAAPFQLVLEQLAEQLHRQVLEGSRRATGEVREPQATFDLGDWHDLGRTEEVRGVGPLADAAQVGLTDVVDEQAEHGVRQSGIPLRLQHAAPPRQLTGVHARVGRGQEEAAVGGKTLQQDVAEAEDGDVGLAAG